MDHIDIKILRYLTKDARMNASQISQKVNLSISAVIERMKKLEASGLIECYTTIINQIWGSSDSGSIKKLQVNMANIR